MEILEELKAFLGKLAGAFPPGKHRGAFPPGKHRGAFPPGKHREDPAKPDGLARSVARLVSVLSEAKSDHPLELLKKELRKVNPSVRSKLGRHPHTPQQILSILAQDEDERVRSAVAENPKAPPEILRSLASDRSVIVMSAVAKNENTPEDCLRRLAKSRNIYVQKSVAENRKAPLDVLESFLDDPASFATPVALLNPALPLPIAIERFKKASKDKLRGWYVEWVLLHRFIKELHNLPEDYELWRKMWRQADPQDRKRIEAHPFGAQVALLERLAGEPQRD